MTTADDPNVRTDPNTGEQIVLEPGDEGYVEPAPSSEYSSTSRIESTRPDAPGPQVGVEPLEGEVPPTEDVPPPQDLTFEKEPGESDAEFAERSRNTVVVSENPGDIVPNMPQITMGPQEPVEDVEEPPLEEPLAEGEPEPEVEPEGRASAADLIERAEAANSREELDDIEAQADGRVTVLNAVEKRRGEL